MYNHQKRGWTLYKKISFDNLEQASKIETQVLKWLRLELGLPFNVESKQMPQGGWTETVSSDEIELKDIWVKVLELVDLTNKAFNFPHELSGGEKQRVAIARAIVNQPEIIIADEPTGNLDSKTSYEIMGLFNELHKKGNTIILVTHEEDIALYAHRIVRLKDGIIESDKLNTNVTIVGENASSIQVS
jgi:ABC-type polar amino acid transport system ATPase subunit